MDIGPISLEGRYVRLEPLREQHAAAIFAIGQDSSIWTWMLRTPFTTLDEARELIAAAEVLERSGAQLPFAIIDRVSGRVAGSTRYLNISHVDCGLEIGHTWLGVEFQRTAINTECKFLLLQHAFEVLGCARVQLKTDARNERSRRAIERIGATLEGVLRKYQRTRGDHIRDTAMYSVTDDEWPCVRDRLLAKLGPVPSTA